MKKTWITVIIFILLVPFMTISYAENTVLMPVRKSGEVTLIIEMEGETAPVFDAVKSGGTMLMSAPDDTRTELLMAQESVKNEIARTIDNVDIDGFSYTTVFNGFSIKADAEDIKTIMSIDGVKNVYISELYPIELHTNDVEETLMLMAEQTEAQGETAYTGRGQAIAIIDSGFCVDHQMFSGEIESPKYEKTAINSIISSLSFGNDENAAGADEIYISEKIPFAYDYGDGDSDSRIAEGEPEYIAHGTHVAGIAGGNNGVYNGELVKGVATDAQLLLMKIHKTDYGISVDAVLAAMDDAVKLGACAINLSLGSAYVSESCNSLYTNIINNARAKGVIVSASAGNSSMELFYGDANRLPRTENIDYSTSGVPAVVSAATSVGAAAVTSSSIGIPNFSSFGVTENLELNPEISAPGYSILSSISTANKSDTNKYGKMSGTSMAAPYITGAVAVLNEYLDAVEDDAGKTILEDRANLVENLLMSTAEPIEYKTSDETTLFSPRLQGAGLVSIEKAVATDVIVLGDEDRTKLSLGEIGDDFTLNFSIKNMSDTPITFDNNSVTVTSDGYVTSALTGKNYISGTPQSLQATDDLAESITVAANSKTDISVTIALSSASEIAAYKEVFPNGFFVDGFVKLNSSAGANVDVGIPFMGFYGDWTSAPALDTTMYDEGGSLLFIKNNPDFCGTLLATLVDSEYVTLGMNTIDDVDIYEKENIAISPNGDGKGDALIFNIQPLRTLTDIQITIKNSSGEKVGGGIYQYKVPKFWTTDIVLEDNPTSLPEGDYSVTAATKFNYSGARAEEITLPFTVDKTKPSICSAKVRNGKLVLTAQDSNYIKKMEIFYTDNSGESKTKEVCVSGTKGEIVSAEIDVSDINLGTATARAMDYAMNYSDLLSLKDTDRVVKIEIGESMTQTDSETAIEFAVDNTEAATEVFVIVGFYDADGKLIAADAESVSIPSGESEYMCRLSKDTRAADSIKVMLWSSEHNLVPADPLKILKI